MTGEKNYKHAVWVLHLGCHVVAKIVSSEDEARRVANVATAFGWPGVSTSELLGADDIQAAARSEAWFRDHLECP